jgi:hypothetical protein
MWKRHTHTEQWWGEWNKEVNIMNIWGENEMGRTDSGLYYCWAAWTFRLSLQRITYFLTLSTALLRPVIHILKGKMGFSYHHILVFLLVTTGASHIIYTTTEDNTVSLSINSGVFPVIEIWKAQSTTVVIWAQTFLVPTTGSKVDDSAKANVIQLRQRNRSW